MLYELVSLVLFNVNFPTMKLISLLFLAAGFIFYTNCERKEQNNNPTCSIIKPASGTKISRDTTITIAVKAADEDGKVVEISLSFDDSKIASVSTENFPFEFEWNTANIPSGTHNLKARVFDNKGAYGEDTVQIIIGEVPEAAFSVNKTTVKKDNSISFSDESTQNPSSWRWDFGDGNTSTKQNPSHTYSSTGSYTVELMVSNDYGKDTELKKSYITVYREEESYWKVGPNSTYATPANIASLVSNGDTIGMEPTEYLGKDACVIWRKNNLLIKGEDGMAHMKANGAHVEGKGIWVVKGDHVVVENIEFSDASVPDKNGAGIRLEGNGLTVRSCYFHDNENGILGGSSGNVVIKSSEFARNGYGDGYSHNIYINHAKSLTLKYCFLHNANVGHEIKSRAHQNYIHYNWIGNRDGNGSRSIDLPNGGLAIVLGNVIEQGPNTSNSTLLGYGCEGLSNDPPHSLFVVNNTMVNNRQGGVTFVDICDASTDTSFVYNNLFAGPGPAEVLAGFDNASWADSLSNLRVTDTTNVRFVDPSQYNYHLRSTSPAVEQGSDPENFIPHYPLKPRHEYVHPMDSDERDITNQLDIGAFEY